MTKLNYSKKYDHVFSYESKKGTKYGYRFPYFDNFHRRKEASKRGFDSEKSANRALLKTQLDISNQNFTKLDTSKMTVQQWATQWMESKQGEWRETTRRGTMNIVNKYVIPLLGKQDLKSLNKAKYVSLFINPLREDFHLAPTSIQSYHKKVMALMNAAVENEFLDKNKLNNIHFDINIDRRPFSEKDLQVFNRELNNTTLDAKVFFYILELTGMRKGECLALTWNDIYIENNNISISKTRGDYGIDKPKTKASIRDVLVSDELIDLLKKYKIHQKKKCLRLGIPFEEDSLVITNYYNRPFSPSGCGARLNTILKRCNIDPKKYVIHSLRHTHATYLLTNGMDLESVAKRLGHGSSRTTQLHYSHVLNDYDKRNVNVISNLIKIV